MFLISVACALLSSSLICILQFVKFVDLSGEIQAQGAQHASECLFFPFAKEEVLVEICCLGLEVRLAKCVYLAYSLFEGMETDVEDIGIGLGELIVAEQRILVIVDEDGTIAVPEGVLCGLG